MVASTQALLEARWDDVRLFLALFRERSLAAAGARVGFDGSTLSRRLVALEELLGARLFDRTRDGLLPTEAAHLLAPAAEDMEAAETRFARAASGFERKAEGVVRVSVPPGVADAFVAPSLARLHAKHPRIRIDLDASTRLLDLTRREADLALRTIRPTSGDLVMTRVGASPWVPMVAKGRSSKRLASFVDVPWIAWGEDLAMIPPALWLSKHVPNAEVVLRTSHIATQVAAVEAGLGAALFPLPYEDVKSVTPLRAGPSHERAMRDLPMNELWLVGHRALRDVPRIAAVWDFLVLEMQAQGGSTKSTRRAPGSPGRKRS